MECQFQYFSCKKQGIKSSEAIKSMNVEGYNGYVNLDISFVSKYKYFVGEGLSLYTWYLPKYAGLDTETGNHSITRILWMKKAMLRVRRQPKTSTRLLII